MENPNMPVEESSNQKTYGKAEILEPNKNLLWKLYLGRKNAFVAMNKDVDEIVNQCLTAKRHLQAVEDSNRNLKQEARSLRFKYETLLEKNRKDTGIIMRLKNSELLFKKAVKDKIATSETLLGAEIRSKEKTLERKLLQDNREKLILRSQVITNILRRKNLRHKELYELILDENKKHEDNDKQFVKETQDLRCILARNDDILEKWLKDNAGRDAAIRRLQDDMKNGLMIYQESNEEDETDKTVSDDNDNDKTTDKTETDQLSEDTNPYESTRPAIDESRTLQNNETEEQRKREMAFHKEYLSKKTLFQAAEKQKEHLIDFYMVLNKRMQDLNTEIVNVREWLLDKTAEKREMWERALAMEKLVSEKRRQKPVPMRTSTDEIKIWIDVQRQTNDALREIAYKCLSIKLDDSTVYSEFVKIIRYMYFNTLKEQLAPERENLS